MSSMTPWTVSRSAESFVSVILAEVCRRDDVISNLHEATLRHCFEPLWVAMRVMGAFPVQHTPLGSAVFRKNSAAFGYAVLVYILIGCLNLLVTINRVTILNSANSSFNALIFSYMLVAYCSAYWLLPIGHWFGASQVAAYLNKWSHFQNRASQLTGKPLVINSRKSILFWTISIPVMIILLVLVEFFLLRLFVYWEAIYFVYIGTIVNYHYLLWYYVCSALTQASAYLMNNLTEKLRAHSSDRTVGPAYREMWEELRALTKDTGNLLCYTYGSILVMTISILTTSLYGFMSETDVKDGFSKQIGLVYNSMIVLGILFLLCNSAHVTTYAVGKNFCNRLKQLDLFNKWIRDQLEEFEVAVTLDPPRISLDGYVTIDRGLLLSLMGALVSYLVILQQFDAQGVAGSGTSASNNTLPQRVP